MRCLGVCWSCLGWRCCVDVRCVDEKEWGRKNERVLRDTGCLGMWDVGMLGDVGWMLRYVGCGVKRDV